MTIQLPLSRHHAGELYDSSSLGWRSGATQVHGTHAKTVRIVRIEYSQCARSVKSARSSFFGLHPNAGMGGQGCVLRQALLRQGT
jgi:hypothetical protein